MKSTYRFFQLGKIYFRSIIPIWMEFCMLITSIVHQNFDVSYDCNDPVNQSECSVLMFMRNSVLFIFFFVKIVFVIFVYGKKLSFCAATNWISKIILLATVSLNVVLFPFYEGLSILLDIIYWSEHYKFYDWFCIFCRDNKYKNM